MAGGRAALGEAAAARKEVPAGGEPARQSLDLVNPAVAEAGRPHVAGAAGKLPPNPQGWGWRKQGGGGVPRGDRVGWLAAADFHLEPEATCTAVPPALRSQAVGRCRGIRSRARAGGWARGSQARALPHEAVSRWR